MRKEDFDEALTELQQRVTQGAGVLESQQRQAIASGSNIDLDLATYAEKVRKHAYKVVDEDVAQMKANGYSEDAIFEATISAAMGAAMERWNIAKAAMEGEGG